jgi:hypothetical protein
MVGYGLDEALIEELLDRGASERSIDLHQTKACDKCIAAWRNDCKL